MFVCGKTKKSLVEQITILAIRIENGIIKFLVAIKSCKVISVSVFPFPSFTTVRHLSMRGEGVCAHIKRSDSHL